MNNTVVFDPVIGKNYEMDGKRVLGRRVLVVGASHYCDHYNKGIGCCQECGQYGNYRVTVGDRNLYCGRRCERFTAVVYERYRNHLRVPGETNWMRTLSRFYNSFFEGGNPTAEERNFLLDHLVCTEYVQGTLSLINKIRMIVIMVA